MSNTPKIEHPEGVVTLYANELKIAAKQGYYIEDRDCPGVWLDLLATDAEVIVVRYTKHFSERDYHFFNKRKKITREKMNRLLARKKARN